ncbi:XRE family transcriptional regulator [Anabaena sp. UHCC 0399]|uniref:XRE family transcriptional regulator n=1 Tax=Anabaena sp. UHCC 0399 TaxID=3110238 RepID=UPI002B2203C4|nr:XRE family transcriptional regulator [Anabaena sp. UHCC 0399]MEA5564349.1 XRE family transcriptional regulator [Anabaena sp. UHCC 0399]
MNELKKRIYVSGALTGINNSDSLKEFYVDIGLLCEDTGFQAYIPHLNTDPNKHPNISPRQVFETDKHQVTKSDLVIAYIGYASLGVGMELAYAETNAIPIIMLYEKGKVVSRFPRGIPSVLSEIEFKDYQDALIQLDSVLKKWRQQHIEQYSSAPFYST